MKFDCWRIKLALGLALLAASCSRTPAQKEAAFLKSGRTHLEAKDFNRAIIDFSNAAQVMPDDAEAHYQLALSYLGSGNAQEAVNQLLKTIALDPKHVTALLKLAGILTINNNPAVVKEGLDRANDALAIAPNDPDALSILGAAELRFKDSVHGIEHLQQVLQVSPGHLGAASTLAIWKVQNKDPAGAAQVLEAAAAVAPRSVEHAIALGGLYLTIQRPADAEKQFRRGLDIDPKHGPALTALANLLYRDRRIEEAGQLFQRASALPISAYRTLYGLFLLENGKTDAASAEFERLYKQDPEDREVRTQLVSSYIRSGRTPDAEKVVSDALKRHPKDADALIQRAELFLAQGKFDEAQADLTQAIHDKPDSPEGHIHMAKVHHNRKAFSLERQELQEALRLNPKLLSSRIDLARSLILDDVPVAAVGVLDEAPEEDRATLPWIEEKNAALYAAGNYSAMRKGVDQGLAIAPNTELLLQDGLLRIKQKDAARGRDSLVQVLKRQPQEWRALEALALSYAAENKLAEATSIVREYTSRVSNSAAAQMFLGTWLSKAGDLSGARSAFQAAKSMMPDSTPCDFELAELDLREGKLDSARSILASVVQKQPNHLGANLDLAQIEYRNGRLNEAIVFYEKAVQIDPKNVPALNNLAYLLADTGKDPDRALVFAQKVKEIAPGNPTVNDTIGWAYYKKGLFQEAVSYLSLDKSTTPRWKCHLAMAYIRIGRRKEARAMLDAALKQDPTVPESRIVQDMLARVVR